MNEKVKILRDSAAMRWTALLLLAMGMFCAYIFMDILSPIKDLMYEQRGWDSTAFGTMQGAETFLNVFVFFLIFAGIILDKMGVRFTAVLSGAVISVVFDYIDTAVPKQFENREKRCDDTGSAVWIIKQIKKFHSAAFY